MEPISPYSCGDTADVELQVSYDAISPPQATVVPHVVRHRSRHSDDDDAPRLHEEHVAEQPPSPFRHQSRSNPPADPSVPPPTRAAMQRAPEGLNSYLIEAAHPKMIADAKLKAAFILFDSNDDGRLELGEFDKATEALVRSKRGDSRLELAFIMCTGHADAHMHYGDFVRAFEVLGFVSSKILYGSGEVGEAESKAAALAPKIKAAFEVFDEDDDGVLSHEEFERAVHTLLVLYTGAEAAGKAGGLGRCWRLCSCFARSRDKSQGQGREKAKAGEGAGEGRARGKGRDIGEASSKRNDKTGLPARIHAAYELCADEDSANEQMRYDQFVQAIHALIVATTTSVAEPVASFPPNANGRKKDDRGGKEEQEPPAALKKKRSAKLFKRRGGDAQGSPKVTARQLRKQKAMDKEGG